MRQPGKNKSVSFTDLPGLICSKRDSLHFSAGKLEQKPSHQKGRLRVLYTLQHNLMGMPQAARSVVEQVAKPVVSNEVDVD